MKNKNLKAIVLAILAALFIILPAAVEAGIVSEDEPNDFISSAQNLDSFFVDTVGANVNEIAEMNEFGTLALKSVSVLGSSSDNTYDYYSFSVGMPGSRLALNTPVVFDIDYAWVNGLDTVIVLYDSAGNMLEDDAYGNHAYNDDSPFFINNAGDLSNYDDIVNSFLNYEFSSAGTYYIRVGQYYETHNNPANPYYYGAELNSGTGYVLHVSTIPIPGSVLLLISGFLGVVSIRWKSGKINK